MPQFYYMSLSPPCRAVSLTGRILGVNLQKIHINLIAKEHKTEEFKALHEETKVPVVIDDGMVLCESRTIMKYLVRKYGKENDQLYPKDIEKLYQIDRFLDFDGITLFTRFAGLMRPFLLEGKPFDNERKELLSEAVGYLDKYLTGKKFITGDNYTLADISLVVTASQIPHVNVIDMSGYPYVNAWLERCKTDIPYYNEENEVYLKTMKEIIDKKMSQA